VVFDYRPRLLLVLATTAWVVLLLAAPLAAFGVPLSGATYAFGSVICHQRPERSFHLGAAQLPVCARCFGLYAGAVLGALAGLKGRPTSRARLRALIVVAAVPTAVTWAAEILGLWFPANATRFAAALPLGAAAAVTVNYVGCAQRRLTGSRAHRTPI
jgi:uncharacterized membrane protein